MPKPGYVAAALVIALAITFSLRAIPFVTRSALKDSSLLTEVGRWMPLGAIGILAIYCVARIDLAGPSYGVPELTGVVVTVALHWWRRNVLLSIVGGTTACLLLANWILAT